jgi:hypothetical protein
MKKRNLAFAIAMSLGVLATPATSAESFLLNSYSPDDDGTAGPVSSDTVLKKGVPYSLQVDGSYSWWKPEAWQEVTGETEEPQHPSLDTANGLVGMDITSLFALPTSYYSSYHPGSTLPIFRDVSYLQISLDGGNNWFRPQTVERQYQADHTYTFRIVGEGHPLQVQIGDSVTSDNYGQFRLQLHPTLTSLGDGLVAYFPFNGNTNDASGYEHHGTADTELPNFVPSPIGLAGNFNGENNGLQVAQTELVQPTQAITLSAWVKVSFPPPDYGHNKIVSNSRNPMPFGGYWLDIIPQSAEYGHLQPRFVANTNEHEGIVGATKLNLNQWHHLVGIYDGKNRYIFVDGKLDGMNTADSSIYYLPGNQFWIGKWHDGIFDGQIDQVRVYNRALLECEVKTLHTGKNECPSSEVCQLYGVQDNGLNDSQLFTINPDTLEVNNLGEQYPDYDIESLDTHPDTGELYAASGDDTDRPGYLYKVNTQTGELTEIGSTGFAEIEGLSFDTEGTLWAWAKGDGLISVNTQTGVGTLIIPSPVAVEDITWNNNSTLLYASQDTHLWVYDGKAVKKTCDLPGQTEALEMLPNNTLLVGIHGQTKLLEFQAIDLATCETVLGVGIPTRYDDIEGIAWPVKACAK